MAYRLFLDSDNGVTLDVEYATELTHRIFKDESTGKTGAMYRYIHGTKEDFDVVMKWVNSSTRAIVNSWWEAGTDLLFKSESETAVYSVHITNNTTPIIKFIKPYDDLFEGKIELKGY